MLSTEAEFQRVVATLAGLHGVLHYHTHDSRRSDLGFPDSVFVGRGVMFRELKLTKRSRVRPQQRTWIDALRAAGVDADIWYAEDYHCGRVDEQLRDLAVRRGGRGGRRELPPLSMRLAKKLYVSSISDGPAAKAELLWEAGIASVNHAEWIATAQQLLAVVSTELPATEEERLAWLSAHDLGAGAGTAAIFTALKSDLTARPSAGQLAAPGEC